MNSFILNLQQSSHPGTTFQGLVSPRPFLMCYQSIREPIHSQLDEEIWIVLYYIYVTLLMTKLERN